MVYVTACGLLPRCQQPRRIIAQCRLFCGPCTGTQHWAGPTAHSTTRSQTAGCLRHCQSQWPRPCHGMASSPRCRARMAAAPGWGSGKRQTLDARFQCPVAHLQPVSINHPNCATHSMNISDCNSVLISLMPTSGRILQAAGANDQSWLSCYNSYNSMDTSTAEAAAKNTRGPNMSVESDNTGTMKPPWMVITCLRRN